MKKYLLSFIPPAEGGGVRYLMQGLEKLAYLHDYEVLYPSYVRESIKNAIHNPFIVIPFIPE